MICLVFISFRFSLSSLFSASGGLALTNRILTFYKQQTLQTPSSSFPDDSKITTLLQFAEGLKALLLKSQKEIKIEENPKNKNSKEQQKNKTKNSLNKEIHPIENIAAVAVPSTVSNNNNHASIEAITGGAAPQQGDCCYPLPVASSRLEEKPLDSISSFSIVGMPSPQQGTTEETFSSLSPLIDVSAAETADKNKNILDKQQNPQRATTAVLLTQHGAAGEPQEKEDGGPQVAKAMELSNDDILETAETDGNNNNVDEKMQQQGFREGPVVEVSSKISPSAKNLLAEERVAAPAAAISKRMDDLAEGGC